MSYSEALGPYTPFLYWIPVLIWIKGTFHKRSFMANMIIAPLSILFTKLFTIYSVIWIMKRVNFVKSHSGSGVPLPDVTRIEDSITPIGRDIKEDINNMSEKKFRVFKEIDVNMIRSPAGVSRGYDRMLNLIDLGFIRKEPMHVVEFGAGRGGMSQAMTKTFGKFLSYQSYSRWNQPGQERIHFTHPDIKRSSTDAVHIRPGYVDTFISDMGENHSQYDEEIIKSLEQLHIAERWLMFRPRNFAIRIPNVLNENVLAKIEKWQGILGQGRLVRLPDERNSVAVMYFISGPTEDVRKAAWGLASILHKRIEIAEEVKDSYKIHEMKRKKYGAISTWPEPGPLPVPNLKMMDLRANIPDLRKPIGTTNFMKEIGWKPSKFKGSKGTIYNPIVYGTIKAITGLMRDFGLWKTTSTLPQDTYTTIENKVDKAPKERHQHHPRLWEAYKAISKFIRNKGTSLRRLTEDEMIVGSNKDGAMGFQEDDLGHANLGSYLKDTKLWKDRLSFFQKKLREGKPVNVAYNSIGKKERKQGKSSRLIWFMPATARIHETLVLGYLDTILKKLPQSVSGMPLYDYGEKISRVFTEDKAAICDDVAGWDTKISYSILCQECEFLKSLTEDKDLQREIEELYRLYAYPLVWITRPYEGATQDVLCQLQGQVASGRRVTYAMNTITNMAVTLSRAAISQGVPVDEMYDWVLERLEHGHDDKYGGFISGDDSVIIMSKDNAKKFATVGAEFMNDIGMPRKNIPEDEPSRIIHSMLSVDFCSHSFTRVRYYDGENHHHRWMPIRSASEILAKASIPTKHMDKNASVAWARAQALNMIVNYHHIPTVRRVALSILSGTPNDISLEGTAKGWSYRSQPWITQGNVIDIVNRCLFGESTTYPTSFRVGSMGHLAYVNRTTRHDYDVKWKCQAYRSWKKELNNIVTWIRTDMEPNRSYDDWIRCESESTSDYDSE